MKYFKLGYNIFDIREDYSCPHDMGFNLKDRHPQFDYFVDHHFYWNRPLILPACMRFNENVFCTNVCDPQFQRKKKLLCS